MHSTISGSGLMCFFFSSRRRHTRCSRDWSSDVCSSDLGSFMKTAIKRKTKPPATFEEEYRSAFGEYARSGGEAALGRAYELGRRAITEKKSFMEIAFMHHQAIHGMLAEAQRSEEHTSELQSRLHLVCRLLLEKKNTPSP